MTWNVREMTVRMMVNDSTEDYGADDDDRDNMISDDPDGG